MHKYIFALLAILLKYIPLVAQSSTSVTEKDLELLTGAWEGQLTYLDYQTSKPYTMPANLRITQIDGTGRYRFENLYPDEPHANSSDTFTLKGHVFRDGKLVARKRLDNGQVQLITSSAGTDGNDNQPTNFRHTYTIGKTIFHIKKEVQFVGTSNWILRHEYRYKRSSP